MFRKKSDQEIPRLGLNERNKKENLAKGSFISHDLPVPKARLARGPLRKTSKEDSKRIGQAISDNKSPSTSPKVSPRNSPSVSPRTSPRHRDLPEAVSKEKGKLAVPGQSSEDIAPKGPKLEILVAGGGPCGLIFSGLLANYAGEIAHIRVYEARVKREGGKIVWKNPSDGNTRREQVVTLQNDVTRCLPKDMRDYLFRKIDEEAWPTSRNIPIREVEDQMLEYVQLPQFKDIVEVVPEQLDDEKMKALNGTFDILVGADGSRSWARTFAGIQTRTLGTDKAMGVAYETPTAPLPQSTNILLTVSQTRYLLNSHKGERGFLNLRLEEHEWEELAREGRMEKRPFPIEARNSLLWNVILDGLTLFQIPPSSVKAIMPIEIQLTYAAYFMTAVQGFKTTVPTGNDQPRAFVIGDAAFRVHFWPGRGLNSAIKGAIALARAVFWAYDREHKDGKRMRSVNNWDFSRFEGFMAMLRAREEEGRSRPVTEMPLEGCNTTGLAKRSDWLEKRARFRETMVDLRSRLEGRPEWPHKPIPDSHIDEVFLRLSPLTINMLQESGTWPLAEMAGEEVDPRMLFSNPTGDTEESRIVRANIARPVVGRGK